MFTIDEYTWPYPCNIEREAEMRPSEISGMLLDRTYFNDVIGTFLRYTVKLAVPLNDRDACTRVYELLTEPVEGHVFTLPYNQGRITVTGRVLSVPDTFLRLERDGQYWRDLRFTVLANHPSRALTLGEAISRGRAPIPDVAQPNEGDTFIWTDNHWAKSAEYPDADAIAY